MITYYNPKTRRRVSTAPDAGAPRRVPPGLIARWEHAGDVRWYDERGRLTAEQVAELGITGRRGPKPRAPGGTQTIGVRLTPAERATWGAAAGREGMSLAEWLRAAAELAISRGSTR